MFKNIASEDKTKYYTFYSNSKAEVIINKSECYVINITISKNLYLLKLSNKDNGMISFSFVLLSLMLTLIKNMHSS